MRLSHATILALSISSSHFNLTSGVSPFDSSDTETTASTSTIDSLSEDLDVVMLNVRKRKCPSLYYEVPEKLCSAAIVKSGAVYVAENWPSDLTIWPSKLRQYKYLGERDWPGHPCGCFLSAHLDRRSRYVHGWYNTYPGCGGRTRFSWPVCYREPQDLVAPSINTYAPTRSPSGALSLVPTATIVPSGAPSNSPTTTVVPSGAPSDSPTTTVVPSGAPSDAPTKERTDFVMLPSDNHQCPSENVVPEEKCDVAIVKAGELFAGKKWPSKLRQYEYKGEKDWPGYPCGCFLSAHLDRFSLYVHGWFNTSPKCDISWHRSHGFSWPVCYTEPSIPPSPFVMLPSVDRSCPSENEVLEEECSTAITKAGANFVGIKWPLIRKKFSYKGKRDFSGLPCGCFLSSHLDRFSLYVHGWFNTSPHCGGNTHFTWPVCTAEPSISSPYKVYHGKVKCPAGKEVTKALCDDAGNDAVMSITGKFANLKYKVVDGSSYPCGCFLLGVEKTFFNKSSNCESKDWLSPVCYA